MSDLSRLTKADLIDEIERLRSKYEECSEAMAGNGKFDEDELFQLAGEIEGDELFLVTETGRFVFVNDSMLVHLGYEADELLATSLPRIDQLNTRAQWLGRVSRLKQSDLPEVFESEQQGKDGSITTKEITAAYVNYRSRNYVLCVGRLVAQTEEEKRTPTFIKTREQTLQQMTSDGVMVVDTRGTITETNAVADRLLGVSKNEVIGRSCTDSRWRLVDVTGEPLGIASHPVMVALVEEQSVFNRRVDMLNHDGTRRSMLVNASPLHDVEGELIGAIGCIRPFDDSAERGDQLQRLKKLQAMEREALETVIHGGSEDDLERRFCQLLVTHGDYPLVWRGVTQEKDERIHPSAVAGSQSDYLMKVKIRYDNSAHGSGPLGKAMKTREPVAVADTIADPTYAPWRSQAEKSNLHSLLALPLIHDNEEYGLLTVYAQDRNHFVGPDLVTLKLVASLLAYGIATRRGAEADAAMRDTHVIQEKVLSVMQDNVSAAVAIFDGREPFRCSHANAAFAELLDEPYRSLGVENYPVSDFMYSIYHRDLYQHLQTAANDEEILDDKEAVFTDWQGNPMHWSWRIQHVPGSVGEDRLLYIAVRKDNSVVSQGVAGDPAESPESQEVVPPGDNGTVAASGGTNPLLLTVAYPSFGPRTRMDTRIRRFLEEGIISQANSTAARHIGGESDVIGHPVSVLFDDSRDAEFLAQLLAAKDNGGRIDMPLPGGGGVVQCTVFYSSSDDGQRICFVGEN